MCPGYLREAPLRPNTPSPKLPISCPTLLPIHSARSSQSETPQRSCAILGTPLRPSHLLHPSFFSTFSCVPRAPDHASQKYMFPAACDPLCLPCQSRRCTPFPAAIMGANTQSSTAACSSRAQRLRLSQWPTETSSEAEAQRARAYRQLMSASLSPCPTAVNNQFRTYARCSQLGRCPTAHAQPLSPRKSLRYQA